MRFIPDDMKHPSRRGVVAQVRLLDATRYRQPPACRVSILHRVSVMFLTLLMPFVTWLFDTGVSSDASFDVFPNASVGGIGSVPALFVKLATLVSIWSFLQHFCVGDRHLYLDLTHSVDKQFGRVSALVAIGMAAVLTLVFAQKLFTRYGTKAV